MCLCRVRPRCGIDLHREHTHKLHTQTRGGEKGVSVECVCGEHTNADLTALWTLLARLVGEGTAVLVALLLGLAGGGAAVVYSVSNIVFVVQRVTRVLVSGRRPRVLLLCACFWLVLTCWHGQSVCCFQAFVDLPPLGLSISS